MLPPDAPLLRAEPGFDYADEIGGHAADLRRRTAVVMALVCAALVLAGLALAFLALDRPRDTPLRPTLGHVYVPPAGPNERELASLTVYGDRP